MADDDQPDTTITIPAGATRGLTPAQVDELIEDLRKHAVDAANKIRASRR
jgi:hypothetical protein